MVITNEALKQGAVSAITNLETQISAAIAGWEKAKADMTTAVNAVLKLPGHGITHAYTGRTEFGGYPPVTITDVTEAFNISEVETLNPSKPLEVQIRVKTKDEKIENFHAKDDTAKGFLAVAEKVGFYQARTTYLNMKSLVASCKTLAQQYGVSTNAPEITDRIF